MDGVASFLSSFSSSSSSSSAIQYKRIKASSDGHRKEEREREREREKGGTRNNFRFSQRTPSIPTLFSLSSNSVRLLP